MSCSQGKRKHCNSVRREIYEAYPRLGSAQIPMETDEFVVMARGRPDGWFSLGARRLPVLYRESVVQQYR